MSRHVVGKLAAARALCATEALGPRWDAYFRGEYVALLSLGVRPPLLEGWERFLATPDKREDVERLIARALARPPSEMDTHPPLSERLAALGLDDPPPPSREARALRLLADSVQAERDAIGIVLLPTAPPLRSVGWDEIGMEVWLPAWRKQLAPLAATTGRWGLDDLPRVLGDPGAWSSLDQGISISSADARRRRIAALLGLWLTVWLADRGASIDVPPGGDAIARRAGHCFSPERRVRDLARGAIDGPTLVSEVQAFLVDA